MLGYAAIADIVEVGEGRGLEGGVTVGRIIGDDSTPPPPDDVELFLTVCAAEAAMHKTIYCINPICTYRTFPSYERYVFTRVSYIPT